MSVGKLAVLSATLSFFVAFALIALAAQGNQGYDGVIFLGYLVGTAVSGNVHSPNEPVVWAVVYLIVFVLVWCVALLGRFALRHLRANSST